MEMRPFGRLLAVPEARARLERSVRPIRRSEEVDLDVAFGRIAARTVRARQPIPRSDRASWDGYAVRSAETRTARARAPVGLRVVGELFAEQSLARRLRPGETVAIATGATLPPGSDAVAIFEEVERRGTNVLLRRPVRSGERVARAGHDLAAGAVLVQEGERIGPAALGALAAGGLGTVRVWARPVVALVPNGNELQRPGEAARPGGVYESNSAPLAAVVRAAGGIPLSYPPVEDSPRRLESTLRRALGRADLVLATGGSSVGEHDHLPRVFPRLGHLLFHGIAVRPGKPTLAARSGEKLLLGLPGHPASCLSNMYWLVLPVLRQLARQPGPGWTERAVRLAGRTPLVPTAHLSTVIPLERRGDGVRSTFRGSSAITSLRAAGGFTLLPPGAVPVRPGERLRFFELDPPLGAGAPAGRARND